jgi:hypothetical protein
MVHSDPLCFSRLDLVRSLDECNLGLVVDDFDDGFVDGDRKLLADARTRQLEKQRRFIVFEELSGASREINELLRAGPKESWRRRTCL